MTQETPTVLFGEHTLNGPLHLRSRLTLAVLAQHFFDATKVTEHYAATGKQLPPRGASPQPLTISDFLKYLDVKWPFSKRPNALRVAQFMDKMAGAGLLTLCHRGKIMLGGLPTTICISPSLPMPAGADSPSPQRWGPTCCTTNVAQASCTSRAPATRTTSLRARA